VGLDVKYPHKRKRWRTTLWKKSGIRLKEGVLLLARAKGLEPVRVALPDSLLDLPLKESAFHEARLVWDRAVRHYAWHLVVEDGKAKDTTPGSDVAAVDLGEIHPAAVTDGNETVVISCRALRSNAQYTQKRVSELRAKQDRCKKDSRRWKRVAAPQEPFSGQATTACPRPGTQSHPRCRAVGRRARREFPGRGGCARRGRWQTLERQEPAEDWRLVARKATSLSGVQGSGGRNTGLFGR
jgi:hypothetical protein